MENGSYDEAVAAFEAMGDYKDSADKISETKYQKAVSLMESGSYDEAISAFKTMGDYKDSAGMISETKYQKAVSLMASGNKGAAAIEFCSKIRKREEWNCGMK